MRRVLLVCGAISSLLYLGAIDVLAPIAHPEYHRYASQMVSELFASGAPTRALLFPWMVVYNALVFALAAGVWTSADGSRATRLMAVALLGYGVVSSAGLLLAPMDVRTSGGVTTNDVTHIAATAVQGIFMAAALILGAFVHGTRFRAYSVATLLVCIAFGALAGREAGTLTAGGAAPWIGLTERVNVYAWMLWLLVLAVSLLRPPGAEGRA